MLTGVIILAGAAATAAPPPFPGATDHYRAWVAAANLPGSPEGLTLDAQARLYVSISDTGEILRLDGHGGYESVAIVPSAALSRAGRTWGLEFDRAGYLYAAYVWHYSAAAMTALR